MDNKKYIQIGQKYYKKIYVILFFSVMIIMLAVNQVYYILNSSKRVKVTPKTKEELIYLIKEEKFPLDMINTSEITDMSWLFHGAVFFDINGIKSWDVSNVENMEGMFYGAGSINDNLSSWNISKVKNMQYMFAYVEHIDKEHIQWNITDNVNYYGIFRGTSLEDNPPEWFKLKNEFELKYFPNSSDELEKLLSNQDVLAGEIDVSNVYDILNSIKYIKRCNKSYFKKYKDMLMKFRNLEKYGNHYMGFKSTYSAFGKDVDMMMITTLYFDYKNQIEQIHTTGFFDKLETPKTLIHDDYPGIEFWNTRYIDEILNQINE